MAFLIKDNTDGMIFNTDEDHIKLSEAQKEAKFHPSYTCFWMLDDEGLLCLENSCGKIEYPDPDRWKFIELIKDED